MNESTLLPHSSVHYTNLINRSLWGYIIVLVLQVVYLAETQFWNVAVGIAPVWLIILNIALYAKFSQNVFWKIRVWKYFEMATPRVPDWKCQISAHQVWPKCLSMVFSIRFFIRSILNSQKVIFTKQNDEGASKLNLAASFGPSTWSERNKCWNLFWKSWSSLISDSTCAHNWIRTEKRVTTGETIVVRYISSVFVALSVWKTSPVGEIRVEIQITHIFSSAETQIAHEWARLIVWLFDLQSQNCCFLFLSHDPPHITLFWPKKLIRVEKPRQFGIEIGQKWPFSVRNPWGSRYQIFSDQVFFQSTLWLNSAYNAIFEVQIGLAPFRPATLQNWVFAKVNDL